MNFRCTFSALFRGIIKQSLGWGYRRTRRRLRTGRTRELNGEELSRTFFAFSLRKQCVWIHWILVRTLPKRVLIEANFATPKFAFNDSRMSGGTARSAFERALWTPKLWIKMLTSSEAWLDLFPNINKPLLTLHHGRAFIETISVKWFQKCRFYLQMFYLFYLQMFYLQTFYKNLQLETF